jgi:hypothetical protein
MARFITFRVQNLVQAGTAGTTVTNKLTVVSSTGITVGDIVYNSTDNTFATVTVIDSGTLVTLSADIMASGEAYSIYSGTLYTEQPVLAESVGLIKRATANYNTNISYITGGTGTDVVTILHQPVSSAYDITVQTAVIEAMLDVHASGNRPNVTKLVDMPTGINVLSLSIG